MKCKIRLLISAAMISAALTSVRAEIYGPTIFMGDVSVGAWTAISNVQFAVTNGGAFTNGVYTNYYRLSGTNLTGRIPGSTNVVVVWTGAADSNNAVTLSWPRKAGIASHVIERSLDAGATWTNWASVSPTVTNYTDTGTNTWSAGVFTNLFSPCRAPTVPWGDISTASVHQIVGGILPTSTVANATTAGIVTGSQSNTIDQLGRTQDVHSAILNATVNYGFTTNSLVMTGPGWGINGQYIWAGDHWQNPAGGNGRLTLVGSVWAASAAGLDEATNTLPNMVLGTYVGKPGWEGTNYVVADSITTNIFLHGNVLPPGSNTVDVGSIDQPFRTGYFHTIVVSSNSVVLGNCTLSADQSAGNMVFSAPASSNAIVADRTWVDSNCVSKATDATNATAQASTDNSQWSMLNNHAVDIDLLGWQCAVQANQGRTPMGDNYYDMFVDQTGINTTAGSNWTWTSKAIAWTYTYSSNSYDISSRLCAHFLLNDNVANTSVVDAQGNWSGVAQHNTTTLSTNGVSAATGGNNGALLFRGNDWVNIGSFTNFNVGSWTVALWYYSTNPPLITGTHYLVSKDASGNRGWNLYIQYGKLYYEGNGGAEYYSSHAYVTASTWQHLVWAYSSGQISFYYNAVIDGTGNPGAVGVSTTATIIGDRQWSSAPIDGRLDDIRFYNRALTAFEITNLYHSATGYETNDVLSVVTVSGGNMRVEGTNAPALAFNASSFQLMGWFQNATTNNVLGYISPNLGTNWYLMPWQQVIAQNNLTNVFVSQIYSNSAWTNAVLNWRFNSVNNSTGTLKGVAVMGRQ